MKKYSKKLTILAVTVLALAIFAGGITGVSGARADSHPAAIAVVEGGVEETTALLEERYDHILYTGNARIGRVVMEAAAKFLTPVTLELGGKSPCIVDRGVNIEMAAKRIAWGKFINAGQTCIAPDYVLAHEVIEDELIGALERAVDQFYGDSPHQNPDYTRDYYDSEKRYIGNAVQVHFRDGSATDRREVMFPIGHRLRRNDALELLEEKFKTSIAKKLSAQQCKSLWDVFADQPRLEATPVNELMALMVPGS